VDVKFSVRMSCIQKLGAIEVVYFAIVSIYRGNDFVKMFLNKEIVLSFPVLLKIAIKIGTLLTSFKYTFNHVPPPIIFRSSTFCLESVFMCFI
jgi:hypothetical protein